MTTLIEQIQPLYIDHFAVTTPDLEATTREYLALPGARINRGPGDNPAQKVRYCFVQLEGEIRVEILGLPANGDSPIAGHLERGGGAYHLCYAVADLEQSIARAVAHNARLVVPPRPDPAHDGRKVAFLFAATHGLLELVEAYPSFMADPSSKDAAVEITTAKAATTRSEAAASGAYRDELIGAFRQVLRKLDQNQIVHAHYEKTEGWDSLAHLQIVMEVERRFGIRIPMTQVGKLDSFAAFEEAIAQIKS